MSPTKQLRELEGIQFLRLPKGVKPPASVPEAEIEVGEAYRISCTHTFYPPASAQEVTSAERQLGRSLPQHLVELLSISNGADLFRIHHAPKRFGDFWLPKYRVLGTSELASVNLQLLDTYLSYVEEDEDYSDNTRLDYVAFCDVGDGNFLALLLEGQNEGLIFYLDHDYAYYPYRDVKDTYYPYRDVNGEGTYTHIAGSLEEWFDLLIQSSGRDGIGDHFFSV
jgi:hypothetical protein